MAHKLKEGQVVTINIPFVYTIGEEGFHTGKVLETIEDCKDEVLAEIEAGVLSEGEVYMEVGDVTEADDELSPEEIEKLKSIVKKDLEN